MMMSYHTRWSSPKVCGCAQNYKENEVLGPEVVPVRADSFASLDLRTTHVQSDLNLLNFADSI